MNPGYKAGGRKKPNPRQRKKFAEQRARELEAQQRENLAPQVFEPPLPAPLEPVPALPLPKLDPRVAALEEIGNRIAASVCDHGLNSEFCPDCRPVLDWKFRIPKKKKEAIAECRVNLYSISKREEYLFSKDPKKIEQFVQFERTNFLIKQKKAQEPPPIPVALLFPPKYPLKRTKRSVPVEISNSILPSINLDPVEITNPVPSSIDFDPVEIQSPAIPSINLDPIEKNSYRNSSTFSYH